MDPTAAKPLGKRGSLKQGTTGDGQEHADTDAGVGGAEEESPLGTDGRTTPSEHGEQKRIQQNATDSLVSIEVTLPNGKSEKLDEMTRLVKVLTPEKANDRPNPVMTFTMTHPSEVEMKVEMKVAEADKEFGTLLDIGLTPDGAVELKCITRGHFCPLAIKNDKEKEPADDPNKPKLELRPGGVYRLTLGKEHEDYCRTIQRLRHLVSVGLHVLPEPGSQPEGDS